MISYWPSGISKFLFLFSGWVFRLRFYTCNGSVASFVNGANHVRRLGVSLARVLSVHAVIAMR